VALELVVEADILICPPEGQNAHIEARVSARGGIMGGSGDVFDGIVGSDRWKADHAVNSDVDGVRRLHPYILSTYYGVIPKQVRVDRR
jgi:hypothetical protein